MCVKWFINTPAKVVNFSRTRAARCRFYFVVPSCRHLQKNVVPLSPLNSDLYMYKLPVIIGPTATGKTAVATRLAVRLGGEVLSGDSRQVYRGMDIGTGKDLDEYTVDGVSVPYHLIDIVPAGFRYNLYMYQRDFYRAYLDIRARGRLPILCGGTGLYIEAVLGGYQLLEVPVNPELRAELEPLDRDHLRARLLSYPDYRPHNETDFDNRRRTIRAIEIAHYYANNAAQGIEVPEFEPVIIGIDISRELRRARISARLDARLKAGMVDEVRGLLASGVKKEDLEYYGLEYKYVTRYVAGELDFDEMHRLLEISIHQFAKRQMTWFRGMAKRGYKIAWIDGSAPLQERVDQAEKIFFENN